MVYRGLRRLLFRCDAEQVHLAVSQLLSRALHLPLVKQFITFLYGRSSEVLQQRCAGLHFPSPVGLAAGFDKEGQLAHGLHRLGFGFGEVGTVTLNPQAGNPRPRLWRLEVRDALENRMGFNSGGVKQLVERLRPLNAVDHPIPIGVNIGKNRDSSFEAADEEYAALVKKVYGVADFIVINVSSPNTEGLRDLQQVEQLAKILNRVAEEMKQLNDQSTTPGKPLFVKLAPEVEDEQLIQIMQLVLSIDRCGVILCNTLKTERGGLSGRPLHPLAVERVRQARTLLGEQRPLIGVGGVFDVDDACRFFAAGADLVEVYTGWVYSGPGLVRSINRELERRIRAAGAANLRSYILELRRMSKEGIPF